MPISVSLQVVRILVAPSNPQQATGACQKVIHQCGLLKFLCDVLMASGVPADILTEVISPFKYYITALMICKVRSVLYKLVREMMVVVCLKSTPFLT